MLLANKEFYRDFVLQCRFNEEVKQVINGTIAIRGDSGEDKIQQNKRTRNRQDKSDSIKRITAINKTTKYLTKTKARGANKTK